MITFNSFVSNILFAAFENTAYGSGNYTLSFKITVNFTVKGTDINTATLDNYTYTDVNGQLHHSIPQQATAETIVQDIDVHFSKDVSPKNAKIGDTVIYTLTVTNNSSIPITEVLVKDISVDLQYVSIFQINLNDTLLTEQPNLTSGVSIASIEAASFATITFQATVLSNAPNPIHNTSSLNYTYFDGTAPVQVTNIPSNTTALAIVIPGLLVEKFSKKSVLINNDTVQLVQYTIYVTNTGNVPIDNVVITDQLPAGMIYSLLRYFYKLYQRRFESMDSRQFLNTATVTGNYLVNQFSNYLAAKSNICSITVKDAHKLCNGCKPMPMFPHELHKEHKPLPPHER